MSPKLSVNVDHVATLREARRADHPRPLEAARIAEEAGADGITVHLRGDRRHIHDADVEALAGAVKGKLNLEMALTEEMVTFAIRVRPHQVTLVPERASEITTEGGLDIGARHGELVSLGGEMAAAGIAVSVFVDPDEDLVRALSEVPARIVTGYELNTDAYAKSGGGPGRELERIAACAALGPELDLAVYAGHGLTTANVGPLAELEAIEEFNIGHAIVSRSVLVGMRAAVQEMLAAIASPGS